MVATVSVLRLPGALDRVGLAAWVRQAVRAGLPAARFQVIDEAEEMLDERGTPCVSHLVRSHDLKARGAATGDPPPLLQQLSLYCRHPGRADGGLAVAFSTRGPGEDPSLPKRVRAFVAEVVPTDAPAKWRGGRPRGRFVGAAVDPAQAPAGAGPGPAQWPHRPLAREPSMHKLKNLLAAAVLAGLALGARAGIDVHVQGEGPPVLMIPGLSSGAEVWDEACPRLGVQCHQVRLPGFAGQPAMPVERYLEAQRDALRVYLDQRGLRSVDVVGHSLGGNLALMLAASEPERVRRVVLVDSLPFLAALRNPAATPEQARQMAEAMRAGMARQPREQLGAQLRQMAAGMTRSPERQATLVRWGEASDGATVAQAMAEIWGGDFRPLLPPLRQPLLVLGAWAAYAPMGSTLESTRAVFERQYQGARSVKLSMSPQGFHFLMWDDPEWLAGEIRAFLR